MIRKRIAMVTATMLVAAFMTPGTAGGAVTADNSCWNTKRSEKRFAKKINNARSNAGVRKLSLDPELSKVARKHTREMTGKGSLFHTTAEQFRKRVTNWTLLGENVGAGAGVSTLHTAFMSSPLHKANILKSSFRHVGVGVSKVNGTMWVTVVFEARSDPGTTLKMPSC
ncbi:MAG TPA: CAP domain-containing protein [Actinomycetota bacterium]|nr:CAP domain-containing protein [Actinomycetota bacterium]